MRCRGLVPVISAVFLAAGCGARQTQFAVEAGQPALIWGSPASPNHDPSPDPAEDARAAEVRLRQVEEQSGDELATAEALFELAVQRRRQGDVAEAQRLYERALDLCERAQGRDGADVATALNALGTLHAAEGDYAAAKPMLERAVAIRRAALGNDAPLTAQSMNNLALLYAAQGNVAGAEPLYLDAIDVFETTGRAQTGALEQVLMNYAALLRDTGRDAEANQMEVRAGVLRAARKSPQP